MEIPQTILHNYLKEKTEIVKTGVVVIDGIFYTIADSRNGCKNCYNWAGKTFSLNEGPSLLNLEKLYFKKYFTDIESYIKFSLESIIGEKEKKLLEKQKSLLNLGDNLLFAKKVIEEITPNFERNPHKRKKKPKKIKKSYSLGHGTIEKLVKKDTKDGNFIDNISVINEIINEDLLIMADMLYILQRKNFPLKKDNFIYVNRNFHNICKGVKFDLEKFEKLYKEQIIKKINSLLSNKESSLTKQLKRLTREEEMLEILSKNEYLDQKKKVGFKITNNKFHVCVLVEDSYIFYDPVNKKYYGFGPEFNKNPILIGIPLIKNIDTIDIEKPVVINKYKHPSLYDHSEYQEICTGDYEKKRPKKTTEDKLSDTILEIFEQVIFTFTRGYTGMTEWKKFHENEKYWEDHLLTSEIDKIKVSNNLFIRGAENGLL